ncbi:UDP-N-acetylmuramyl-tripeptide synthetase/UDP-N-acetylmuramoyl-tripeptide--D-alanyl-D-alanine ligase [alpha proteobacterium HIMB5]|nr:UDP-N-acetylmuramyl-tripeptide synthetase/UDP-N-acetylmuramoyl-tripeptide--D-alanyl-D-alanine ligase [alpha proteobacterium HIMB5]
MLLKNYFQNLKKEYSHYTFSNIAFDSSKVKKNYIFFAIKGNMHDGHLYINDAIKKGAKIIIHEKKFNGIKNGVLFLYSKNVRKKLAEFSFKINKSIPKNLIAVTGTNGKSSVADFYFQILKLNNIKVASIGTLGVKTNDSLLKLPNTTIDPLSLSQILKNLKKQKVDNVILEASSHGLVQNRLDGLKFEAGIFTNLSHDHLDYHKTMKNYLKAKLYLFQNLLKKNSKVVIDQSVPQNKIIKKICKNNLLNLNTISDNDKKAKIKIDNSYYDGDYQIVELKIKNKKYKLKINLIGKIQIKNLLMAIVVAENSKLSLDKIIRSIPKIKSINGRLENIDKIHNKSKVILDYAHTPDALKTVLVNIKDQFPNKMISIVFGCGGNRDKFKRPLMGRIVDQYCDKIYLTDDNPRNENPNLIRKEIKKGIKKKNFFEIKERKKAIDQAINDLKTGEILLVAGKGHEETQTYKNKEKFFSDRKIILNSINKKNKNLSQNIKINIISEQSNTKLKLNKLKINKAVINSKEVKKDDIFFTLKGKKNDAHNYLNEVFKNKASIAVVNKIHKNSKNTKQIKVKETLKFLSKSASIFRDNIDTHIIAITGSSGKTSLKDLLGFTLSKIDKTSFSRNSFNNKFGVPLSLFNIDQSDKYGVVEVGMDKKGEIDFLSKIIKPNVAVITNISYAHIKNFKNILGIAAAKGEIISNIKKGGSIVLNHDDKFFKYHHDLAQKKNLKIITFSSNKTSANIYLKKLIKKKKKYQLVIRVNDKENKFYVSNNFKNLISNILCAIAVISIYFDVSKLSQNIFKNIKNTEGRGDYKKIKIKNKIINLIDESYNSNPLSLKSSLANFDKININKKRKHIILGDMLELGKFSKKLHKEATKQINKISINKVNVIGKHILETYKKINKSNKGKILKNDSDLTNLIFNDLQNGDYLMVKGSNSTGLFNYISKLKRKNIHAL